MLLSNLALIPANRQVDILIEKRKIKSVSQHDDHKLADISAGTTIKFNNAIVFPGLINSHDHLDFNLFPKLGNKIYRNYIEWGEDIHQQHKEVINSVLKVSLNLRIQWGIYKNLLNGITTVVNHGPGLPIESTMITILQQPRWQAVHSIKLDKKWRYKLNMPFTDQPFVIHIGEGTDNNAKREIDTLLKWNLFKKKIIGIHGIAMDERQGAGFEAIVWCPDSNYFLMGRTAPVDKLKSITNILFGTDSNVSSGWNLWEHLRLARREKVVTDLELFNMVTAAPAQVWQLPGYGAIAEEYNADIIIAKRKPGLSGMDAFFAINPMDILMVIHKGTIRLFDSELYELLDSQKMDMKNFCKIFIDGSYKHVSGDIPGLMKKIKDYYQGAFFPTTCLAP